jgi:hypothetical protein
MVVSQPLSLIEWKTGLTKFGSSNATCTAYNTAIASVPGLDPALAVIDCTPTAASSTSDNGSTSPGGLIVTAPHPVSISGLSVLNATGATGGGLLITGAGASAIVSDVTFDACKAMSMGGGVHVRGGATAALTGVTVTRCSGGNDKTGNHNRGGGVYIEDATTTVTLTNVTITKNSLDVSGKGGGLNVDSGARVNASGLVVSGNSAFFAAGIFIGNDCATNINRAMITDNRADYGAGIGVFAGGFATLTSSLISGNAASKWGGGLLVYSGAKATLQKVSFENNAAELGGGAVAYTQSSFTAIASKFVVNKASEYGGAIHLQTRATVALVHTRLQGNVAAAGGGGAHITSGASLSVTGGELSGNNASQSGGGILCEGGTYGGGNLSMTAGTAVTGNTCGTLGGGVHLTGGCFAVLSNAAFRGNAAGPQPTSSTSCEKQGNAGGGAVAVDPHAASGRATTLVASECSFTDNVAPDGGAVIVTDTCKGGADCQKYGAQVHLTASVVSGNKAIGCQYTATSTSGGGCASQGRLGSGGGIYAASGVVSLSAGTAVEGNVATASGGGVQCQGAASLAVAGRSTRVDGNVAGDTGGGVMHAGRQLSVTGGASFSGNRATDGGAVAIILSESSAAAETETADPVISFEIADNVTLSHNLATRRGGAFYISASMARSNLSGIALRNSTAAAGSGFYWVRAASPGAHLQCRECSLGDGSDNNNNNNNNTAGASSPYESRATEALSLSSTLSSSLELQSGVTAPLFTVTLVDFYGRVASTEDGVPCRLEAVTPTASGTAVALEVSGVLTAQSSAGVASFDQVMVRGRLGSGYTGRFKCNSGDATASTTTTSTAATATTAATAATATTATTATATATAAAGSNSSSSSAPATAAAAGVIDEMLFPLNIAHCSPGQEPLVAYVSEEGVPIAKECAACKVGLSVGSWLNPVGTIA